MKLKLPLLLLHAILLLQSSFARDVILDSNSNRQEYTDEVTIKAKTDSLIYTNWNCSDPFNKSKKKGAIFHSTETLTFNGEYSLTILKGKMKSLGGFIYSDKSIVFQGVHDITIKDNVSEVESSMYTNGIINAGGDIAFSDTGHIIVTGNSINVVNGGGGKATLFYASDGGITFTRTGDITITHNLSSTNNPILWSGGTAKGIHFQNVGHVVLSFNKGRVLYAAASMNLDNLKSLTFEGNYDGQDGGAIDIGSNPISPQSVLKITNAGEVKFINNSAWLRGGAIGAAGLGGYAPAGVFLSADNGNILFRGNTEGNTPTHPGNPIANSINFMALAGTAKDPTKSFGNLTLRAQAGREIIFYDPVITHITESADKANLATVTLNQSENDVNYDGIIRFDGSQVTEYIIKDQVDVETDDEYQKRLDKSRYSDIQGKTSLSGGSLILTNEVVYGRKLFEIKAQTEFNFHQGILEISKKSQLHAYNFTVDGLDSIFRMDQSSHLETGNFTANAGLSFDLDYWTQNPDANVVLKASNASFAGIIGLHDGIDTYSDNQWANKLSFNLIDAKDVSSLDKDKLSGIQSNSANSSVISDPYSHKGTWTYKWVGTQLIATWTPLGSGGDIEDVRPELEGNIVSNSMWSSASNAKALSNTALVNANILRFESSMKSNFWVKGIGDFAYDDSTAELDGYSYQGGGYAAGADFKLGKKSIVGVAFGQLMGDNKSELYTSKIKQDSMMGSLYAAHLQTLNKRNSLLWTLAGTYGDTENSMNTHYSDGDNSSGSWNNNAYFVEAKMEWRIAPEGKSWTYKPFIGVEYTDVCMDSFTESGDKARHFAEGSYKNIALPIGIGFEHQSHFGKKTWLNSLSLAYVPDVYREAPNTQATRLSNGFSWKDQGSKPSIHTLRATINSTLQLNASWTAYAGYTFEAREDASYHNVNAGVSYSF